MIQPSWSYDGKFISCGHTDSIVNIWDIRYTKHIHRSMGADHAYDCGTGHKPTQDPLKIDGDGRVYQALFHRSRNLLITTNADRKIGLHTFTL